MLKITQAPTTPVQVKQKFVILGVASAEDAGKTLTLTIDRQMKTSGPVIAADASWRLEFLFLQAGNRHLEISVDNETVGVPIQVVETPVVPRLRFTDIPQKIQAEEAFILGGQAEHYDDGDQLVLKADRQIELARPRVKDNKWQAALVFHQAGKRLIEVLGSEQDRAQIIVDVQPADLQVLPRNIWTSQPTPADLPDLRPKRITLHHTAIQALSPNASQAEESQRMKRLWEIHVQGNGWSDIGYHYVIMPSGRIYEGRAERKRGAHDSINDGIGIAFDGIYTQTQITPAQFQSAVALCTKLCQRYGINDPVTPVATPTYSYGTRNLPRICGHRDRVQTECPGSEGGRTIRLEEIRQAVKRQL